MLHPALPNGLLMEIHLLVRPLDWSRLLWIRSPSRDQWRYPLLSFSFPWFPYRPKFHLYPRQYPGTSSTKGLLYQRSGSFFRCLFSRLHMLYKLLFVLYSNVKIRFQGPKRGVTGTWIKQIVLTTPEYSCFNYWPPRNILEPMSRDSVLTCDGPLYFSFGPYIIVARWEHYLSRPSISRCWS